MNHLPCRGGRGRKRKEPPHIIMWCIFPRSRDCTIFRAFHFVVCQSYKANTTTLRLSLCYCMYRYATQWRSWILFLPPPYYWISASHHGTKLISHRGLACIHFLPLVWLLEYGSFSIVLHFPWDRIQTSDHVVLSPTKGGLVLWSLGRYQFRVNPCKEPFSDPCLASLPEHLGYYSPNITSLFGFCCWIVQLRGASWVGWRSLCHGMWL